MVGKVFRATPNRLVGPGTIWLNALRGWELPLRVLALSLAY